LADCEVKPYQVEGEIGRVTFDLYRIKPSAGIDDTIAKSLFPELHAKEWYRTVGFKKLALVHGTVGNVSPWGHVVTTSVAVSTTEATEVATTFAHNALGKRFWHVPNS